LFESIGGWKLLSDENKQPIFPSFYDLFMLKNDFDSNEAIMKLDAHFDDAFHRLLKHYEMILNPDDIIKKIEDKLRIKKIHSHVQSLISYLELNKEDLMRHQKESLFFKQLCRDLAWDSLVKHELWYNISDDDFCKSKKQR